MSRRCFQVAFLTANLSSASLSCPSAIARASFLGPTILATCQSATPVFVSGCDWLATWFQTPPGKRTQHGAMHAALLFGSFLPTNPREAQCQLKCHKVMRHIRSTIPIFGATSRLNCSAVLVSSCHVESLMLLVAGGPPLWQHLYLSDLYGFDNVILHNFPRGTRPWLWKSFELQPKRKYSK